MTHAYQFGQRSLTAVCFFFVLTLAISSTSSTAQAESFVVVANAANSQGADKELLKTMYLKKRTAWPSGKDAKPYGRKDGSDAHKAVLKMLGMSDAQLTKHWLDLKQKTGQTRPKDVGSDRLLLKLVSKDKGAFGIASAEKAKDAEGVKIIMEIK